MITELRGLRMDVTEVARAGIRAQLLVARLQLQEQRITTPGQQVTELRQRIAGTSATLGRFRADAERFDEGPRRGGASIEEQQAIQENLRARQVELTRMQRDDHALRAQEAELSSVLAGEQARWADFNSRLDELERTLPSR